MMTKAIDGTRPPTPGERTEAALGEPAERRNLRRLVRWVAAFVAWPSLSIGLAFLVFTDPSDHWLHIAGLLPLGAAALVLFAMAPTLAKRWVPDESVGQA